MLNKQDLIKTLANDLGMLISQIELIARTAPLRYKVFTIPKRDGTPRVVAQPAREVKAIQRWLIMKLANELPVHQAATAYRKGTSIRLNAEKHLSSNFILKMDFKNFFPSIEFKDLSAHLQKYTGNQYDLAAIELISRLCSWAPSRKPPLRLCIGAPSSPFLSNSLLFDFDCLMEQVANVKNVTYTRYADDLTFSSTTPEALRAFPQIVEKTLSELPFPKLTLNTKKTVFASRSNLRMVTGLTLTANHQLSVGRERKRLARAMFHHYSNGKLLGEKEVEKMWGLLAFIDHIEPGFSARLKPRGIANN